MKHSGYTLTVTDSLERLQGTYWDRFQVANNDFRYGQHS